MSQKIQRSEAAGDGMAKPLYEQNDRESDYLPGSWQDASPAIPRMGRLSYYSATL
jgi:hypothetical protein